MSILKLSLSLSALAIAATACTSSPKAPNSVANQIKSEPPAESPEAIANRGAEAFIQSPQLSQDQKRKVMKVYLDTYHEAMRIRGEIGKSKSLLFKLAATKKFESKEIGELKTYIVKLDQERLAVMFKALKDVQDIVGTGPDREELWKRFQDFELPHHRISEHGGAGD